MKTEIAILTFTSVLLTSCAPETITQENEVINDVITKEIATETPSTQEIVATESATEIATEPPLTCVTLLTPINGADIPPIGKVTFSWTPLDKAGNYVLNIIIPSGETVSFETDQTFHERYMEAFMAGGEYQWQVIVHGIDGSEICVSEVAIFNKVAYEQPKSSNNGGNNENGDANEQPPPQPTSDPDG